MKIACMRCKKRPPKRRIPNKIVIETVAPELWKMANRNRPILIPIVMPCFVTVALVNPTAMRNVCDSYKAMSQN